MRPSWFKISGLLASLWLVVGTTVWWLESRRPSAEKVLAYVATQKPEGKEESVVEGQIQTVVTQYHKLDFDDRREVLLGDELKRWWKELAKPQRRSLRMQLFPKSRQIVEFFDKLPLQQREKDLMRVVEEARKKGGQGIMPAANPAALKAIAVMGLTALFESTTLDDNIDTLLMLHELEKRFVWRRRM